MSAGEAPQRLAEAAARRTLAAEQRVQGALRELNGARPNDSSRNRTSQ